MSEELEVKIANYIFPNSNFTLEDIKNDKLFVCIDSLRLTDIEQIELLKLCYKKYGQSRHSEVCVFKNSEGFYFTNDNEEALEMNEEEWVGTYCYFVTEVDEYTKELYYPFISEDAEYEYFIELSCI